MDIELEVGQRIVTIDLASGQERAGEIVAISYVAMAVQVRLEGISESVWLDFDQVSTKGDDNATIVLCTGG